MNPATTDTADQDRINPCLIRAVMETMKREPALEAVRLNRLDRTISVATLGRADDELLERHLTRRIEVMQSAEPDRRCGLLEGTHGCEKCVAALPCGPLQSFEVREEANATIVARITCPTAPRFWRWHDIPWPRLMPRTVEVEEDHEHEWKRQLWASLLCGALAAVAYLFVDHPWDKVLYGLAYLAGSWFTVYEVWERLQKRVLDVHFLMLAVAAGSAAIGAFGEGAVLLFLFSLSGAMEHFALGRTQREIRSLFKAAPKTAIVVDSKDHEHEVPVEELRAGLRLRVKPGEQFPVDADIVAGQTSSDESNLTGEATPVDKTVGDTVYSGTLNLWGSVDVTVVRPVGESALQKIIQLIRDAQHRKAPSQRFTDKFGTRYTYGILSLTVLMFFVWWLGLGRPPFLGTEEIRSAFYQAMTLLVVASPCALVLSIPSAVLAAIARAARRGILFRGGAAVEKLAETSVIAMDKTGTLTTGELKVEQVESFPPGRETDVGRLAFSLERLSTHPLARAITRHGKQQRWDPIQLSRFESVTGFGLKAQNNGDTAVLGRREWIFNGDSRMAAPDVPPVPPGYSEAWLRQGDLVGRVVLRDDIRPQSRDLVARLQEKGLKTIVLTGDRQATADALKLELKLDDVRAELKPEQKVAVIEALIQEGEKPAMVGDGVNDAPSLAAAHVGLAMGARGSDAALEQAEVVLMHDRLENVLTAIELSNQARRIIRQNLVVSLGTVVVLVVAALSGSIPLTLGVLGHEGSTVLVVTNSLRLLFKRL